MKAPFMGLLTIIVTTATEGQISMSASNITSNIASLASSCGGIGYDVDLPGNDLTAERESDYRRCFVHCNRFSKCVGFTWTDLEGGTCWLKSGYGEGTAVYKAGAKSGITFGATSSGSCPRKYIVIANCDMPGNNMASVAVPGKGYAACYAAANAKGYFYTWSDYNSGTCWLKSKSAPCVYAPNKYSGIIAY